MLMLFAVLAWQAHVRSLETRAQPTGVVVCALEKKGMRKADLPYRPHGFRSSFRDWVAERTNAPREIAETCLGHVSGSQVERAYRRTDYLEQRQEIMEAWGNFLTATCVI